MAQKFCTYCGANLEGNTKFCTKCGKPLHKVHQPNAEAFALNIEMILAFLILGAAIATLVFAIIESLTEIHTNNISGSVMLIALIAGTIISFAVFVLSFFKKIKPVVILLMICLAFICEMNYMFFCITTWGIFARVLLSAIFSIVVSSLLLSLGIIRTIKTTKPFKGFAKIIVLVPSIIPLALCFECGFPKQFVITNRGELVYYRNQIVDIYTEMNGVSVKSISPNLFTGSKVKEVNLFFDITSIGDNAFRNCSSLTTVYLLSLSINSLTSIGNNAFEGCSSLTYVSEPQNLTSIGKNAFRNCSSLISINIPRGVESISKGTFFGCSSVQDIMLSFVGGSATSDQFLGYIFGANSYQDNSMYVPNTLEDVYIRECVSISDHAFYGLSNLQRAFFIDSNISSIGEEAFYGCSKLQVFYNGLKSQWDQISKGPHAFKEGTTIIFSDESSIEFAE